MIDPRHQNRLKIVQELFAEQFNNQTSKSDKTKKIIGSLKKINAFIQKHAPKFPIDKIARIDLAILRLAVYELTIEKKEPEKVIINEAVELAKELGSKKSYSFVNAVLGKIYAEISAAGKKD
jgi:N utilization substance protein B